MAVTITYLYPATSAPSSANATNMCVATVVASAAADTNALITHALGLSNSEITQGFPRVVLSAADGNEITSPWYVGSQAPNYTVLLKGTVAQGGQVQVTIDRPHSIVR